MINAISRNHSVIKRESFKKLLANQLATSLAIDYSQLYLDLISVLHEKQILILKEISAANHQFIGIHRDILAKQDERKYFKRQLDDALMGITDPDDAHFDLDATAARNKLASIDKEISRLKLKLPGFSAPFLPETYGIEGHEIYFLIQDLCNKGLLVDVGVQMGAEPFTLVEPNQFGFDFLASISD